MSDAVIAAVQAVFAALVAAAVLRVRRDAWAVRGPLTALATGLAAGGVQHWVLLAQRGVVTDPGQPAAFNVFWAALNVADPLGAALLVLRPRWGMALTLAIMVADVGVNLAALGAHSLWAMGSWRLWSQMAFALFALMVAQRVAAAPALGAARAPA